MFSSCAFTLAVLVSAPDNAATPPTVNDGSRAALEEAEVAHAEGLLLELDGDIAGAHARLHRAAELAPKNISYAYDLARLSQKHALPTLAEDASFFMALEPRTADHSLLRTYLLAHAKRFSEARENVERTLKMQPSNSEALSLQEAFNTAPISPAPERPWGFRLEARPEYDSNVNVFPDGVPGGVGGFRLGLGGRGWYAPRFGSTRLNLQLGASGGVHLSNRSALAPYDFFSALVMATIEQSFGDNTVSLTLSTNQQLLGGFSEYFLGEYGLLAEYRRKLPASFWLSAFVDGGWRDYVSERYNANGTATDRDGLRILGGVSASYMPRSFGVTLRAAFQTERAQGVDQRELGPDAVLMLRYSVWRMLLSAGMSYQGRFYPEHTLGRTDHRLAPTASATLAATSWLDLELSYLFVANLSNLFGYNRHLTHLAVRVHY